MDPFDKHIPSVFVASSPFQILCSIAAIKQLDIKDYAFYTRLPKRGARNDQTKNVLKSYNINYKKIGNVGYLKLLCYVLRALLKRESKYKRLFICDMRSIVDYYIGCSFVSDYASVVHLDDGGSTLTRLYGEVPILINSRNKKILSFISKHRHIIFQRNLLTIYGNLPNPQYNIHILSLQNVLHETREERRRKDIVVVGTNIDTYCKVLNLSINKYIEELKRFLNELRRNNNGETILYIPHGRDEHLKEVTKIAEDAGCSCLRPQIMVELELLARKTSPQIIYGYTSTALFTLKKIFPESRVVNILFHQEQGNIYYRNYKRISDYYKINGIELLEKKL